MYTLYCKKYSRWDRVTNATMCISHKSSDAMQVDRAGDILFDPATGELSTALHLRCNNAL